MANYPSGPITFPARSDGQTIFAQHMQIVQDEITALEAGLLSTGLQHALWGAQAFTLSGALTPPTLGVNQNDYAPAGLAQAAVVRQQLSANVTITGLLAQPAGRVITLINFGGFALTLANLSASSAATNRIACPGGTADLVLANGCAATLWYETATSFWRVIGVTLAGGASGPAYCGAKVINAAAQSMSAATYQTLTFTAADWTYGGTPWVIGAPTRLTVPAGAGGLYLVCATFQSPTSTNLRGRLMKNGAVCATEMRIASSAAASVGLNITDLLQLVAGDYLEVQGYCQVAGSIGGTVRDDMTTFSFFKQNP